MEISGSRVLLTGATGGLGHAIAAEYLDRGARVVATVRGSAGTALHELLPSAGELAPHGGRLGSVLVQHIAANPISAACQP